MFEKLHPLPGLFAWKGNPLGREFRVLPIDNRNDDLNFFLRNERGVVGYLHRDFVTILKPALIGAREVSDTHPAWNLEAAKFLPALTISMIGLLKNLRHLEQRQGRSAAHFMNFISLHLDPKGLDLMQSFAAFQKHRQDCPLPHQKQPWSYGVGDALPFKSRTAADFRDGTFGIKDVASGTVIFESLDFSRFRQADAYRLYGQLLLGTVRASREIPSNPDSFPVLRNVLMCVGMNRVHIWNALTAVGDTARPWHNRRVLSRAWSAYTSFFDAWDAIRKGPSIERILAMDAQSERPTYLRPFRLLKDESLRPMRPARRAAVLPIPSSTLSS